MSVIGTNKATGEHEPRSSPRVGLRHYDDPTIHLDAVARQIRTEAGGTRYLFRDHPPRGYVVALTNQAVARDLVDGLRQAVEFGRFLAYMNPNLADSVTVGWWRDQTGRLFIDTGIVLPTKSAAISLGYAFVQSSIALLLEDRVIEVDVRAQLCGSLAVNSDACEVSRRISNVSQAESVANHADAQGAVG